MRREREQGRMAVLVVQQDTRGEFVPYLFRILPIMQAGTANFVTGPEPLLQLVVKLTKNYQARFSIPSGKPITAWPS